MKLPQKKGEWDVWASVKNNSDIRAASGDVNIRNTKGVFMDITGRSDLTMKEMIEAFIGSSLKWVMMLQIIWGAVVNDTMGMMCR